MQTPNATKYRPVYDITLFGVWQLSGKRPKLKPARNWARSRHYFGRLAISLSAYRRRICYAGVAMGRKRRRMAGHAR